MTSTYQTRMEDETYNGFTNFETWNVALWIGNDEGLYEWARGWKQHGYKSFSHQLMDVLPETPDGVKWNDPALNIVELDEMMEEL